MSRSATRAQRTRATMQARSNTVSTTCGARCMPSLTVPVADIAHDFTLHAACR